MEWKIEWTGMQENFQRSDVFSFMQICGEKMYPCKFPVIQYTSATREERGRERIEHRRGEGEERWKREERREEEGERDKGGEERERGRGTAD